MPRRTVPPFNVLDGDYYDTQHNLRLRVQLEGAWDFKRRQEGLGTLDRVSVLGILFIHSRARFSR